MKIPVENIKVLSGKGQKQALKDRNSMFNFEITDSYDVSLTKLDILIDIFLVSQFI